MNEPRMRPDTREIHKHTSVTTFHVCLLLRFQNKIISDQDHWWWVCASVMMFELPAVCMRLSLMLGSDRTCSSVLSPLLNQFSAVLSPTPNTLLNNWHTHIHIRTQTLKDGFHYFISFIHLQSLISLIFQNVFSFWGSSIFQHLLWHKEQMKHDVWDSWSFLFGFLKNNIYYGKRFVFRCKWNASVL